MKEITDVKAYPEIIHWRFAAAILRSLPMSGRATVIAGPLPILFIMASVQAAMMPAVFRVDKCRLVVADSIGVLYKGLENQISRKYVNGYKTGAMARSTDMSERARTHRECRTQWERDVH